jgi:hypothetical protein
MTRLTIFVVVVAAVLAGATTMLRSRSYLTTGLAGPRSVPTVQQMQSGSGDKLPVEDFDDRSLIYPRAATR